MASLAAELAKLKVQGTWIDGEAIVLNSTGMPDFNALQNDFDRKGSEAIISYALDLTFVDGSDIRSFLKRSGARS